MSALTDAERREIARDLLGANRAGKWGYDLRSMAVFATVERIIEDRISSERELKETYHEQWMLTQIELDELVAKVEGLANRWDITGDEDMRFRFVDQLRAIIVTESSAP